MGIYTVVRRGHQALVGEDPSGGLHRRFIDATHNDDTLGKERREKKTIKLSRQQIEIAKVSDCKM